MRCRSPPRRARAQVGYFCGRRLFAAVLRAAGLRGAGGLSLWCWPLLPDLTMLVSPAPAPSVAVSPPASPAPSVPSPLSVPSSSPPRLRPPLRRLSPHGQSLFHPGARVGSAPDAATPARWPVFGCAVTQRKGTRFAQLGANYVRHIAAGGKVRDVIEHRQIWRNVGGIVGLDLHQNRIADFIDRWLQRCG